MNFWYDILPNFQGRGFATEALKGFIDYCFENTNVLKIFVIVIVITSLLNK